MSESQTTNCDEASAVSVARKDEENQKSNPQPTNSSSSATPSQAALATHLKPGSTKAIHVAEPVDICLKPNILKGRAGKHSKRKPRRIMFRRSPSLENELASKALHQRKPSSLKSTSNQSLSQIKHDQFYFTQEDMETAEDDSNLNRSSPELEAAPPLVRSNSATQSTSNNSSTTTTTTSTTATPTPTTTTTTNTNTTTNPPATNNNQTEAPASNGNNSTLNSPLRRPFPKSGKPQHPKAAPAGSRKSNEQFKTYPLKPVSSSNALRRHGKLLSKDEKLTPDVGGSVDVSFEEDKEVENADDGEKAVDQSPMGRFVKLDIEIGRGSFKTVYKGMDTESGASVAWCEIPARNLSRQERSRFRDEAELMKELKHPHIVRFFDYWEKDSCKNKFIVLITELMTSGTLRTYMRKFPKIAPKVIKNWCRQILKGLNYLHTRDPPVIHRDLKCDNIFISGTSGEVKIGDLGLATLKNKSAAKSVIGTPEFMAPEMFDEFYDEKVDIYAFGMCMLEMATNEYPYQECQSAAQIYRRVISGTEPLCLAKADDNELKEIIKRCIVHDPKQRLSVKDLMSLAYFVEESSVRVELVDKMKDASGADDVISLRLLVPEGKASVAQQSSKNEAVQFEYNIKNDKAETVTAELVNGGFITQGDAKTVSKQVKDRCDELKKERELVRNKEEKKEQSAKEKKEASALEEKKASLTPSNTPQQPVVKENSLPPRSVMSGSATPQRDSKHNEDKMQELQQRLNEISQSKPIRETTPGIQQQHHRAPLSQKTAQKSEHPTPIMSPTSGKATTTLLDNHVQDANTTPTAYRQSHGAGASQVDMITNRLGSPVMAKKQDSSGMLVPGSNVLDVNKNTPTNKTQNFAESTTMHGVSDTACVTAQLNDLANSSMTGMGGGGQRLAGEMDMKRASFGDTSMESMRSSQDPNSTGIVMPFTNKLPPGASRRASVEEYNAAGLNQSANANAVKDAGGGGGGNVRVTSPRAERRHTNPITGVIENLVPYEIMNTSGSLDLNDVNRSIAAQQQQQQHQQVPITRNAIGNPPASSIAQLTESSNEIISETVQGRFNVKKSKDFVTDVTTVNHALHNCGLNDPSISLPLTIAPPQFTTLPNSQGMENVSQMSSQNMLNMPSSIIPPSVSAPALQKLQNICSMNAIDSSENNHAVMTSATSGATTSTACDVKDYRIPVSAASAGDSEIVEQSQRGRFQVETKKDIFTDLTHVVSALNTGDIIPEHNMNSLQRHAENATAKQQQIKAQKAADNQAQAAYQQIRSASVAEGLVAQQHQQQRLQAQNQVHHQMQPQMFPQTHVNNNGQQVAGRHVNMGQYNDGCNTIPIEQTVPQRMQLTPSPTSADDDSLNGDDTNSSPLVQYIVVRSDLQKWTTGALLAQACHASTAALYLFRDHPHTEQYQKDLDSMHKVVLQAKSGDLLRQFSEELKKIGVDHKLWIEQPEDIPTAIATRPYPKNMIQKHFSSFKVYK